MADAIASFSGTEVNNSENEASAAFVSKSKKESKTRKNKSTSHKGEETAVYSNDNVAVSRAEFDNLNKNFSTLQDSVNKIASLLTPVVSLIKDNENNMVDDDLPGTSNSNSNRNVHSVSPRPESPGGEAEGEEADGLDYFSQISGVVEELGPKINDTLAKGVTNILEIGLSEDNLNKLHNKFTTPENCTRLSVVKCNDPIFKGVSKNTRVKDIILQKIQKDLTKSVVALSQAFQVCDNPIAKNAISEAMSLICNGSHGLDVVRRNNFKPELHKDYIGLCAENKPIKNSLFGELNEEAKAQAETARITNKITRTTTKKQSSFHPYRRPFLGSAGLQFRKGSRSNHWRPFTKYNNNYGNYNNNNNNGKYKKKQGQQLRK